MVAEIWTYRIVDQLVALKGKKEKVCFYIAQYPVRWTAQSALNTLFALPDRPVHSETNSASPGSILVMQQLRTRAKLLTFPPLSIARYSFIQLSPSVKRTKMPNLRNGSKGGFEPGLTRLRVRHSTTELPRSSNQLLLICVIIHCVISPGIFSEKKDQLGS